MYFEVEFYCPFLGECDVRTLAFRWSTDAEEMEEAAVMTQKVWDEIEKKFEDERVCDGMTWYVRRVIDKTGSNVVLATIGGEKEAVKNAIKAGTKELFEYPDQYIIYER